MAERCYWFVLAALGVWRITHALSAENGPWDSFVELRRALDGGFAAKLLDCFYCLSLWVAVPFAVWIGAGFMEKFLLWLALSAAAIQLERFTARHGETLPARYFEHEGASQDVLLREP